MPIGQILSDLSPRPTPCKQLSLHTAFHGNSSIIIKTATLRVFMLKLTSNSLNLGRLDAANDSASANAHYNSR